MISEYNLFYLGDEMSEKIRNTCKTLSSQKTRGELGKNIATVILACSSHDLNQMRENFSEKINTFSPDYRKHLEDSVTAHLHGTYQTIHLMDQQGIFGSMKEPVRDEALEYWQVVVSHCSAGDERGDWYRFLKYLVSGFCMFVQEIPGHPVGMTFPGGDKVENIDGIYYCPVKDKANDVDSALCPFCPALQTPETGYLKPPVKGSKHRKQEYIKNMYEYHHFNG